MKRAACLCSTMLAALAVPGPAQADELFGGLYVHDVRTPLNEAGIEGGMDVTAGWRGDSIARIWRAPMQPYVFGALNTAGETNYAAAGISAKFGEKIFVRPGLGIALHTGSSADHFRTDKIAFGSRVLFEAELGIGARINQRLSMEASWVHMSHGTLFGLENPGIDNFGVRLNLGL